MRKDFKRLVAVVLLLILVGFMPAMSALAATAPESSTTSEAATENEQEMIDHETNDHETSDQDDIETRKYLEAGCRAAGNVETDTCRRRFRCAHASAVVQSNLKKNWYESY